MRDFFNASRSRRPDHGVENTSRLDGKSVNMPSLGRIVQRVRPRPPHRNSAKKKLRHHRFCDFGSVYLELRGGLPDRLAGFRVPSSRRQIKRAAMGLSLSTALAFAVMVVLTLTLRPLAVRLRMDFRQGV